MSASQRRADGLVWLLTVESSTVRRWVSRDCTVTERGEALACRRGLRSDAREVSLESDPSSETVGMTLPPEEIPDVVRYIRSGFATLALLPIFDGVAAIEDAVVVAGGRVGDVEVDPEGGVLSVGIASLMESDTSDLCPPRATIDERTWPLSPADSQGSRPPLVYGAPGSYEYSTLIDANATPTFDLSDPCWATSITWEPARKSATSGATPGISIAREEVSVSMYMGDGTYYTWNGVGYPEYLIASLGHVAATTVDVWYHDADLGIWQQTHDIILTRDGLGRAVSVVDLTSASLTTRKQGEWWLGWAHGGGVQGTESGRLGAVLRAVLASSTVRIDWQSVAAAQPYLDRHVIGGYIDESVSATAWAADRLPTYGARLRWTGRGAGVVVTVPHADGPPVARLAVGASCRRSAPYRYEASALDEVSVQWAQSRGLAMRQRETVVRLVGDVRVRDEVDAREVWDDDTAARVGRVALWRHGPQETSAVSVDTGRYWWLREGDVIELTDEAMGLTAGPSSRWQITRAAYSDAPTRQLALRRIPAARYRVLQSTEEVT